MASSVFIVPATGTVNQGGTFLADDGSATAPSYAFSNSTGAGFFRIANSSIGVTSSNVEIAAFDTTGTLNQLTLENAALAWASAAGVHGNSADIFLVRDGAANTLALKNGTNAQIFRLYGYSLGARSAFQGIQCVTTAVTASGASSSTGNVIPAGATVLDVVTTTTTTITGASGYTVGDGTDVDRYGDITGTAIGTNSGSTNYTADPRWWTAAARAITLTAKTSNFTGGVVQVCVFYTSATGA